MSSLRLDVERFFLNIQLKEDVFVNIEKYLRLISYVVPFAKLQQSEIVGQLLRTIASLCRVFYEAVSSYQKQRLTYVDLWDVFLSILRSVRLVMEMIAINYGGPVIHSLLVGSVLLIRSGVELWIYMSARRLLRRPIDFSCASRSADSEAATEATATTATLFCADDSDTTPSASSSLLRTACLGLADVLHNCRDIVQVLLMGVRVDGGDGRQSFVPTATSEVSSVSPLLRDADNAGVGSRLSLPTSSYPDHSPAPPPPSVGSTGVTWAYWAGPLLMDVAGVALATAAGSGSGGNDSPLPLRRSTALSPAQRAELQSRLLQLLIYVFRQPFYCAATRRVVEWLLNIVRRRMPMGEAISGAVAEGIVYWQSYYFYAWAR